MSDCSICTLHRKTVIASQTSERVQQADIDTTNKVLNRVAKIAK